MNIANTSYARQILYTLKVAARAGSRGKGVLLFIAGDSRIGKTFVTESWCTETGAKFYPYDDGGGARHVQRQLAALFGISKYGNAELVDKLEAFCRAMPPPRVLVVDELHLMLRGRSNHPVMIEFLRRLADLCGISVVALATFDRFKQALAESNWNDTQFFGRADDILILDPEWVRRPTATDKGERRPVEADIEALHKFDCPEIKLDDGLAKIWRALHDHEKGGPGLICRCIAKARDFAADDLKEKFSREHLVACAERQLNALDQLTSQLRVGALRRRR